MDIASCRLNIERLLKQSCDEKCLRGGSELALETLDEAEAIAKDLHELQGVWLAAIQYRKAHLLMRMMGSDEFPYPEGYSNAHQLFLRASQHAPFAIRGRLYALAAGLKSGQYCLEKQPELLREIFQLVGISSNEMHAENRVERSMGTLDSNLVNLLELSAYYWDTWNPVLEGISHDPLFSNGEKSGAWLLLGNDRDLSRVVKPRRKLTPQPRRKLTPQNWF